MNSNDKQPDVSKKDKTIEQEGYSFDYTEWTNPTPPVRHGLGITVVNKDGRLLSLSEVEQLIDKVEKQYE